MCVDSREREGGKKGKRESQSHKGGGIIYCDTLLQSCVYTLVDPIGCKCMGSAALQQSQLLVYSYWDTCMSIVSGIYMLIRIHGLRRRSKLLLRSYPTGYKGNR